MGRGQLAIRRFVAARYFVDHDLTRRESPNNVQVAVYIYIYTIDRVFVNFANWRQEESVTILLPTFHMGRVGGTSDPNKHRTRRRRPWDFRFRINIIIIGKIRKLTI